ncbi:hypothetical protein [Streptomyces sp. NPDC002588]|uniref:hypothetical protein n=1 Tax=Streptomyces sp. NPDC002588 TaxID=3154419 RepID=UPI0033282F65
MAFAVTLSVVLIVGAAVAVTAQHRAHRTRTPSDLDAEADANHALVRLTGGLVPPDARTWSGADEETARALTRAAECRQEARSLLATARTAAEYGEVSRVAGEGLAHLRTARTGLGLDAPLLATTSR